MLNIHNLNFPLKDIIEVYLLVIILFFYYLYVNSIVLNKAICFFINLKYCFYKKEYFKAIIFQCKN